MYVVIYISLVLSPICCEGTLSSSVLCQICYVQRFKEFASFLSDLPCRYMYINVSAVNRFWFTLLHLTGFESTAVYWIFSQICHECICQITGVFVRSKKTSAVHWFGACMYFWVRCARSISSSLFIVHLNCRIWRYYEGMPIAHIKIFCFCFRGVLLLQLQPV